MINPLAKKPIYTILASALIPIVCSVFLLIGCRDWHWENELIHVSIEIMGSFAALSLAAIFLLLEKPSEETAHHLWVACAMISMGILDLFHVHTRQPDFFVWMHSLSGLTGGILFALVWVPPCAISPKLFRVIPWVVIGAVMAGAVFIFALLQMKQLMLVGDAFTSNSKLINLLGMGFFLLAAIRLTVLYNRWKRPDDLLLVNLCILFGVAGLLFGFSSLWSAVWWFWHFVRMVAYLLILGYLFFSYKRLTEDLLKAQLNLEEKVLERTKELAIANQSLQTELAEHRQAEEHICELMSRQDAIMGSMPDIIMEVDANKVYTWANPAGYEFFGQDVIGKEAAFYFVGEQDTYTVVEPLFQGIEDVFDVESWQRRRDGEKRLLAWRSRALKDNSGNVIGALSSARDITEHKQEEEELIRYRHHLEDLVKERTAELMDKAAKLERLNRLFVGRELRMKELKKKIKEFEGNRGI
ncbi:MAG: PAS domain S-box protein [Desulfobulbaceae bacterium]|nr:PAS domain S-box protein [Desulfobulbaceae bacterium]